MKKAFSKKKQMAFQFCHIYSSCGRRDCDVLCVFFCMSALWKLSICAFFLFWIYNVKNHKFAKFTTSSVIDSGDDREKKKPTHRRR